MVRRNDALYLVPKKRPVEQKLGEGGPEEFRFMKASSGKVWGDAVRFSREIHAYDGRPISRTSGSLPRQKSLLTDPTKIPFAYDLCKAVVEWAPSVLATGVGFLVKSGIESLTYTLAVGTLEAGPPGWYATSYILIGGEASAKIGGAIAGFVAHSILKSLSEHYNVVSFCDRFKEPESPPGGGGNGIGPVSDGGRPFNPGGQVAWDGPCMQCKQSTLATIEVDSPNYVDSDGVEVITIHADRQEMVCLSWEQSWGQDSNFDLFCD